MAQSVIKVTLRSYDHKLIDQAAKKIVENVKRTGGTIQGPIPLPTKREVFTVIRSPHVNKTSREQFERRTHKRLIRIINANEKTIETLMNFDISSGVDIDLKQV